MTKKAQAVSIVIPVYNEEHHLEACLEAIRQQTVKPLEVILVDNNSTDSWLKVVKRYPIVKILHEKQQGLSYARNTGYNAAKGDIIAKIDADSNIFLDWVERLQNDFADPNVTGVTGEAYTNCIPRVKTVYARWVTRLYLWNIYGYFRTPTMWGANMAIRASVWPKIKRDVCNDDRLVHEDADVSLLVAAVGGKIIKDNQLLIRTHKQSYHYFPKLVDYMHRGTLTKKHHKKLGTYDSKQFPLLGFWATRPGVILYIIVGIPFFIASFLLWPFDAYKIRHQDPKHPWFD